MIRVRVSDRDTNSIVSSHNTRLLHYVHRSGHRIFANHPSERNRAIQLILYVHRLGCTFISRFIRFIIIIPNTCNIIYFCKAPVRFLENY